jgi:nucleoside-diphosphate-sugar epimerase
VTLAPLLKQLGAAPNGAPWRIVITGSSGWIGRNAIDLLMGLLGPDEFARRVHLFGSVRRELTAGAFPVVQQPLSELAELERAPTIVLHLAFLTKDRAEVMDEQAYVDASESLRRAVLGSLDAIGAERLFVASSGAAGFADDPSASPAMRLYGALKRADEEAFSAWAQEPAKRAVICRIFSLTGPHINKPEGYALAAFILQALAGKPVVVKSARPVFRSYVPVRELLSLVFALLLERSDGVIRCESGGEPLEMAQIAGEVATQLAVTVERQTFDPDGQADRYVGDADTYNDMLAAHDIPPVSFAEQVTSTISYLRHGCADVSSR